MSSWIKMIDDSEADEDLNLALNQAKTPHGTVDNVLRVHSKTEYNDGPHETI